MMKKSINEIIFTHLGYPGLSKFRTRDIVRIDMRQLAFRRPFSNQFRGKLFTVESHTRIDHATLY